MSQTIRIAIADDHPIFRQGLIGIATKYGFDVVAEADNGHELLSAITNLANPPDVCILDINMPVMNGYEALKEIRRLWPDVHVLALSMHHAEFPVIKMLSGGAAGYLLKDCSPRELRTAVCAVVEEGFYHSELVDDKLERALPASGKPQLPHITPREMLFLSWCCCDLAYKEIAVRMGINARTAESYADTLCNKLGVKSRIGLVMAALQMGVVPAPDIEG